MINFARQAYVNPFLSTVGTPFGGVNPLTWGQQMGLVPTPFSYLPMTAQFGQVNPLAAQLAAQIASGIVPGINRGDVQMTGQYNPLLSQIAAGIVPGINRGDVQMTGQFNPFVSQLAGGFPQTINPLIGQTPTNWPGSTHFSQQGVGDRTGAYGIDPRAAFGATGQQFGQQVGQPLGQPLDWTDLNVVAGLNNPGLAANAISLLMSQQLNPLAHQQLPIRSLINAPQNAAVQPNFQPNFQQGFQQGFPVVAPQVAQAPVTQWPVAQPIAHPIAHMDPYRAFIEAQLISQLAANPLYQLQQQLQPVFQQGYGAPQTGLGLPGVGQQFNPFYGNAPFCG